MTTGRLEAFTDGVLAVLITILVLEFHRPSGTDWRSLQTVVPGFLAYLLSFVFLGIYWNNHHHMLKLAERVNGPILWANLHLLFWLSLVPFATAWLGQGPRASAPTALYGAVFFLSGTAYALLQRAIIANQGPGSPLKAALGRDGKGKVSVVAYAVGIGLAFAWPLAADALYVGVALMWLIPDRRIERHLQARVAVPAHLD